MITPTVSAIRPAAAGGIEVHAVFACGHVLRCWFPHAKRRTSRQQVMGWVFGAKQQDEMCSSCKREAVS